MQVICRTNLDLSNEQWPSELPAVPAKGDRIRSANKRPSGFQLELEVVNVTWRQVDAPGNGFTPASTRWLPEIELHMTSYQRGLRSSDPEASQGSIKAFYEWYAPAVGRDVSAFI